MKLLKYTAAALAFAPAAAHAQGSHDGIVVAENVRIPSEIIVSASGIEQRREEVGQAITVIDSAALERTQTNVISDILKTVPGVRIARNGGVGGVTSTFVRGGESSQTLVLIDGVRINDPSSPNAAFDFGALLTGNIDRVEVLRGPNSVIWGSQAIGGVINVRTLEPAEGFAANARAEYGAFNTAEAAANVSGKSGILSGSVGGTIFRTDGISALAAGTERDGDRNVAANAKLALAFTDLLSLDLRGYFNRGKVQFDDPFGASPDTFPETRNRQYIGYAGLNFALANDNFRNRIAYTRTDIDRKGTEPNVPFSFNGNALHGKVDRFEYQGSYRAGQAITLVFGLEHERTLATSFFPSGGGAAPDRAVTHVTSGYGQVIVKPVTGLSVSGGVRHDDYSQYGGQTTFGANFAYSPNKGNTVLRGTYAEGFRAPTLTEALLPFGNTALKPETAKSFDLGMQQKFWYGQVIASATYFRRTSENQISFSFLTFQSENIASVRAQGLELELSVRPSSTLQLSANYSLVDAKSRSNDGTFGNQLARRPRDNANFSFDWTAARGFTIGSSLSITGHSFDNLANTVRLKGYTLAGLRAAYEISRTLELYGRIENLFDEQYQTVAGYGTYGRNAYIGIRARI